MRNPGHAAGYFIGRLQPVQQGGTAGARRSIAIELPSGVTLTMDARADAEALARVIADAVGVINRYAGAQ